MMRASIVIVLSAALASVAFPRNSRADSSGACDASLRLEARAVDSEIVIGEPAFIVVHLVNSSTMTVHVIPPRIFATLDLTVSAASASHVTTRVIEESPPPEQGFYETIPLAPGAGTTTIIALARWFGMGRADVYNVEVSYSGKIVASTGEALDVQAATDVALKVNVLEPSTESERRAAELVTSRSGFYSPQNAAWELYPETAIGQGAFLALRGSSETTAWNLAKLDDAQARRFEVGYACLLSWRRAEALLAMGTSNGSARSALRDAAQCDAFAAPATELLQRGDQSRQEAGK